MFFKTIASNYDDWYETPLGRFADQVETALAFELFKVPPGGLILDAGCGTGNFSLKLARRGARVIGIDITPEMLALARLKAAKENKSIVFELMDLYNLRYPSNFFDGVISMATFEFIHEPRKAFAELMRVLKPGRGLLIGTINRDSLWGAHYLKQARKTDSIFHQARFMTPQELNALDRNNLRQSGECLFIGPDTPPDKINLEEERRSRIQTRGGFIATLWEKPLSPTSYRPVV